MTRLALLADIHGNLPALEAVIADMADEQFDQVIVAGDLINIGPFSAQVLQTVFERGWPASRGNHEIYLLEHGIVQQPVARRDWQALTLLAGVAERSVVSGHYHLSFERQLADWQIINPGPVGIPMDGLRDASYAILEGDASGWRVEHRRVPVEFAPIFAEFE